MCGIAGAVGELDAALIDAVRRASLAQSHRGPDGFGEWTSVGPQGGSGAILCHRRLSILDPDPRSAQPMHEPSSEAVITYNGELYNFPELRAELERAGERFRTTSDTEVLLRDWARRGPDCLGDLRGMFAFAVWEPRTQTLSLARDRLGIKPLYYASARSATGGSAILFASELRALLATGLVERRLSGAGVSSYLWNGFVQGPQTIVAGIELLPAAHFVQIRAVQPRVEPRRYWSLPTEARGTATLEDLRECLRQTVRCHLLSDVPLGVFLSGGIDSSAVARLAMQVCTRPVRTFNIAFEEQAFDESAHARAVAAAIHSEHHEILLTRAEFGRDLPLALGSLDQPTFDGINSYFVSRAVRERGVTVALAGTGGDELFGGYRSFEDLPRARRAATFLSWMPRGLRRRGGELVLRLRRGAGAAFPPQTRWGKLADVLGSDLSWVELYQAAYALYTERAHGQLLGRRPGSASDHGLCAGRRDELDELARRGDAREIVSRLELANFIENRLLRDTDTTSMALSLEVRVPLLDHRLLETVWALSTGLRFGSGCGKQALRAAALEDLPPGIFDRPKSGFVLPIDSWCRDTLKEQVAAVLHDRAACARIGISPEPLAALWKAFQAGSPGLYWSRVWSPYVLLSWCAAQGVQA
jgi:asparagine synthase (glutamine-hydrolysing)